jgi:hypothetical protein
LAKFAFAFQLEIPPWFGTYPKIIEEPHLKFQYGSLVLQEVLVTIRLELNGLYQFLAFLQPSHRVQRPLYIPNHAVLIHDDGSGALNPNEVLFELKAMIDRMVGIGQDWERRFKRLCIPACTIQRVAKNNQDLCPGIDKLIVHAPQLGDVCTAL